MASTTSTGQANAKPARVWARVARSELGVLVLAGAYLLALAPFAPDLLSVENLGNIMSNAMPLLALAIGQTIVLITGGIDLAVTSIVALASVAGAWTLTKLGVPPAAAVVLAVAVMVAIGALCGLASGVAVTRLAIPPFMVTLTLMMFVSGAAIWMTKSKSIHNLPPAFTALAREGLGPVPWGLLIVGALGAGVHILLTRTVFGRWLYAVGLGSKTARVSGVPVTRVLVLAYVFSGVCAAIASVLYTARLETGSPVLGQRLFLDIVGAAIVGGTSLFGGKGTVLGTACGVLFISLLDNSFNLLGLSSFAVLIAKGTLILFAALVDLLRHQRARRGTA